MPTHTDPKAIAERLREPSKNKIVFTNYHSAGVLASAARSAKVDFDLIIFDEAHRTAGNKTNACATLLPDKALNVRYPLFMTATERKIKDDHADVYWKRSLL